MLPSPLSRRLGTWNEHNFGATLPRPARSRTYASPSRSVSTLDVARLAIDPPGSALVERDLHPQDGNLNFSLVSAPHFLPDQPFILVARDACATPTLHELGATEEAFGGRLAQVVAR